MAEDECVVKHFSKHGGNFSTSIRIFPICDTHQYWLQYYFNQPEKNYYEDNDVVIDKNYNDDADADADADNDDDNDDDDNDDDDDDDNDDGDDDDEDGILWASRLSNQGAD